MEYPRKIKIENEKLKKLLIEKSNLITIGRGKSKEIEKIEEEMDNIDKDIQEVEKTVDISVIQAEAEEVTKAFNEVSARMEEVNQKIYTLMKEHTPEDLSIKYTKLKKDKEVLEEERNKIALKAQKYTDKIIPITRKVMAEHIEGDFEDYETIQIIDGEVVGTIFNHLEDWKTNFISKKK